MGELCLRAGPAALALCLFWSSWSVLDGESPLELGKDRKRGPLVTAAMLPLRGAEEPRDLASPFERPAPPALPAPKQAAVPATVKEPPPAPKPAFAPFVLELQAILCARGESAARISGHTIAPGETIPGCDAVLVSVDGMAVEVRHHGRRYRLDLHDRARVRIEP